MMYDIEEAPALYKLVSAELKKTVPQKYKPFYPSTIGLDCCMFDIEDIIGDDDSINHVVA